VIRSTVRTIVAVVVAFVALSVVADEAEWTRSCRFAVEANRQLAPGSMVFEKRGVADLLGRLADGRWFLVQPVSQQAHPLPADAASVEPGGRAATIKTLPGAQRGTPLVLTAEGLTFDYAGQSLRIVPTPPLLGDVTYDAFLSLCPTFQDREKAYAPRADKVKAISAHGNDVSVEVFFGSWCPHCQEVLPRLIKSLREAGNPNLRVKLIGLPRAFTDDPAVKARGVRGVPTVIVFRKDIELGRFSGTEPAPIEETLAKLVGG
jgi:thiol-disulfide isomerase/thioredoxin